MIGGTCDLSGGHAKHQHADDPVEEEDDHHLAVGPASQPEKGNAARVSWLDQTKWRLGPVGTVEPGLGLSRTWV